MTAPNLTVNAGEKFALSVRDGQASAGKLQYLRPKTGAALKTLLAVPGARPARLHDDKMFEPLGDSKGYFSLGTRDLGLNLFEVRALANSLPDEGAVPERVRVTVVRQHPHDPRDKPPSVGRDKWVPSFGVDLEQLRAWGWIVKTSVVPVPKAFREWKVISYNVALGDITVGRNGTLVIEEGVSVISAQNIWLREGGRIIQRSPVLTVDVVGEVKGE